MDDENNGGLPGPLTLRATYGRHIEIRTPNDEFRASYYGCLFRKDGIITRFFWGEGNRYFPRGSYRAVVSEALDYMENEVIKIQASKERSLLGATYERRVG
jgi:hypothetical protein